MAFLTQFAKKERASLLRLAATGDLVNAQQLAERLDVPPQAIYKAVRDLRMFSLDVGGRTKLYPAFFADQRLDRIQLETICKELDRLSGTSKWQFFANPRLSLSKKNPLDALRKGKFDAVIAAAKAFKAG
nr:HTH domain-containing protein [Duganella flavida]